MNLLLIKLLECSSDDRTRQLTTNLGVGDAHYHLPAVLVTLFTQNDMQIQLFSFLLQNTESCVGAL